MLSINTNLSSIIAQTSMKTSTNKLNQAVERMSTGFKINHAKDNAANYSISTNMTTKLGAYQVAEDNTAMGLDMVTTASESLSLIESKLTRLRALATQANNDTYGNQSKDAINAEANSLVDEITRTYKTTQYNGVKIFDYETTESIKKSMQNIDESKKVKNVTSFVSGETYYITDVEDLVQLQDLTNSGKSSGSVTFELTSDIDMEGVEFEGIGNGNSISTRFRGTFNGNGYVIKNLNIEKNTAYTGLFNYAIGAKISNLGVFNCNISGTSSVGALVGRADEETEISNCFSEGEIKATGENSGLLIGYLRESNVENCYSNGIVVGANSIGGLVGYNFGGTVSNCYSEASVTGSDHVGGFIGNIYGGLIENSFFKGELSYTGTLLPNVGGFVGRLSITSQVYNCICATKINKTPNDTYLGEFNGRNLTGEAYGSNNYYIDLNPDISNPGEGSTKLGVQKGIEEELLSTSNLINLGFNLSNGWSIKDGKPELVWMLERTKNASQVGLQIGSEGSDNSRLNADFGLELIGLEELRGIGQREEDYLSIIDSMLNTITNKQTKLGATQNRLLSALDEILTQYDNLVSSRSTLRDADMAELSSTYIQQQILQEASATLMATANQMPAIALQLL